MTRWLNGPWAAADTETTGVSVETDRIVTACVGVAPTPGVWEPWTILIDPGVDIPAEATAVHGVTTEKARDLGVPAGVGIQAILDRLYAAWDLGGPVVIYNAPFDCTLIDREARRHLGVGLELRGPIIDPLVIDKAVDTYRRGSRKLVDVCSHYGVGCRRPTRTARTGTPSRPSGSRTGCCRAGTATISISCRSTR